jgi:hypothetical protein
MFPLNPSGVTYAVALQKNGGTVTPIGLIIKNCDISMSMNSPAEIRLVCEVDPNYDESSTYSSGPPQPQYPPLDATQTPDGAMNWKEHKEEYGVKLMRTVYASAWTEIERTNCYCCTCSDSNPDPHCRNHGWAGTRACGKHNMPGTPYMQESFDKTGKIIQTETMPQSIEQYQRER